MSSERSCNKFSYAAPVPIKHVLIEAPFVSPSSEKKKRFTISHVYTDNNVYRQCLHICNFYRQTLVLECLFNKNASVHVSNFIKNWLQHRYFPVTIAKFLSTACFIGLLRCLLFQVEEKIIYKAFVWAYWTSVYLFLHRSEKLFFKPGQIAW